MHPGRRRMHEQTSQSGREANGREPRDLTRRRWHILGRPRPRPTEGAASLPRQPRQSRGARRTRPRQSEPGAHPPGRTAWRETSARPAARARRIHGACVVVHGQPGVSPGPLTVRTPSRLGRPPDLGGHELVGGPGARAGACHAVLAFGAQAAHTASKGGGTFGTENTGDGTSRETGLGRTHTHAERVHTRA